MANPDRCRVRLRLRVRSSRARKWDTEEHASAGVANQRRSVYREISRSFVMFACLHFPRFFLQAAQIAHAVQAAVRSSGIETGASSKGRSAGAPGRFSTVVVNEDHAKGIILQLDDTARQQGIHAGMTPAQAMARDKTVRILRRSPTQEDDLTQLLLEQALRFSPLVELTAPGVCIADLRTSGETRQRLQSAARQCVERMHARGIDARIGLAQTPDLAQLAARSASPVCLVTNTKSFVAGLPLDALDPPEKLRAILVDWGIATMGHLMSLPRAELIERLGTDAAALLKRVSPRNKRLLCLHDVAPVYRAAIDFEYEIDTTDPLLFLLRRFLVDLCERIASGYRVVERILLRIPMSDGAAYERTFSIPAPTADVDPLFRVLSTHLETLQLEQRPVGVQLQLIPGMANRVQLPLFETVIRDPNQFGETLARLKALIGNDRVGVPVKIDTHQPDRFELRENFDQHPCASAFRSRKPRGLPLRRYRPARGARVKLESTQRVTPVELESDGVSGRICEVAGPYRLSGDWWDTTRWQTEEWDIELADGGIYRISRKAGQWSIEGCYDASG